MRNITGNAFNPIRVSSSALGSAVALTLAWCNPAQAVTFTLQDEYWIKAGTSFSSVFGAGVSGTAGTSGVYQETATGGTPIVTQLTTTTFTSGFHLAPLPGEFVQNTTPNASAALLLNGGWTSTLFNSSSNSKWQINNGGSGAGQFGGTPTGAQSPSGSVTGTALNFQYITNASANSTSGALTGTVGDFNLASLQLVGSATAMAFTIEGLRNGVVIDTANVSYNFINGFVTFTPVGWTDIDTVAFTNLALGNNVIAIRNINLDPYVAAVPELSSWVMVIFGFAGIGLLGYRRNVGTLRLAQMRK